MNIVPIVIPSLEPDERLMILLQDLQKAQISPVILIDDGSSPEYKHYFDEAQNQYGCTVLRHHVNMGKGRALKTAFNYCLNTYPQMIGCVTADSDGQHSPECIKKCMNALQENPGKLILGCRDFDAQGVPDRSRMGNKITRKVCKLLCGVSVTDTQTGLRAIPKEFMRYLLNVSGERFEFETNMLLETKDRIRIIEVPVETIYDSKDNHQSHFNPVKDSIRIYRLFGREFGKFLLTSVSSCVIDFALFAMFCTAFRGMQDSWYIILATALARMISATYNYLMNYKVVFKSKAGLKHSALRYVALAVAQMFMSAGGVTLLVSVVPVSVKEVYVKIPVDTILFFVSYIVQREFVYRKC